MTVLCCDVYDSCAHWYAEKYELLTIELHNILQLSVVYVNYV